ncbi:MucR family transcriptional regulator [Alsobacter sp. SYSU M60028]|uniref:MucR family transcriptional regulator n=1 Tax=Alsobacter ponti TaxID=2962936 RepID=A0ABT1L7J8_9HYPH|nr:MucR family transcriptional regulator [Alsobacter ponti]MCP8936936.1 MucR family transcriptional regulator [Alsobacter ponti]
MDHQNEASPNVVELTAEIIAAYVSKNSVASAELAGLVTEVHRALANIQHGVAEPQPAPELKPAVPVKKSVHPDYIVCLEDGRSFRSLKRHLRTAYNMSPEEYRAKWSLPPDYPMVAPNYSAARSALARTMGLGQQRRKNARGKPAKKSA